MGVTATIPILRKSGTHTDIGSLDNTKDYPNVHNRCMSPELPTPE